jgi:predicted GIY-YIG superfamily endonuclease
MPYHVCILKCSDGSYYTGSTGNLSKRLWEHQEGLSGDAYTYSRRPIELVWSYEFPLYKDALYVEYQIKGWSRAKKVGLIRGDWNGIHEVVKTERKKRDMNKRQSKTPLPSRKNIGTM